ncbi:MAG: hypothetical protein ACE5FO_12365 [Parvularculaceae bacterium]
MDGLAFVAVIVSYAVVLIWYVANAVSGSPGESGWLAITAPDCASPRRYRAKRPASAITKPPRVALRQAPSSASYARKSIRNRAYRHANGSGYRRRGCAARYNTRVQA